VSASTYSGTPIMNLTYNFNLGNGTTGTDNGNVIQIVNGKDNNRTQNFSYDPLNRIWQAYTTGPNWGETYSPNTYAAGTAYSTANLGIDAAGNLTNISGVTGKILKESLNCAPATVQNQLPTSCQFYYDAAGNLTKSGTVAYTYDAENRLIATEGYSYIYDGDGNRVEKCTAGTTPGTCATNASGMFYWLHKDGGTLNESDLGGNFTAAYDLIHGQIAARIDLPSNAIHYYFHDHLGTTSIVTDAVGTILNESDYYPFGGEIAITSTDSNRYKFTGKERDTESGLDNFGKRYDSSSLGRFMTTDPVVITTERLVNPQQLNLYAYVANNPLRFIDPTGEILQCVGSADQQKQCFGDLQQVAGDAANRLSMDAKTGVVSFDTKDLDLSKNAGAALVNDLVGSKNTYDFSIGPTVMTDKGAVKIDYITANLPTFGDQPKGGNPPAGVSDIVALYFNNPKVTRGSNTNLQVAPEWTVAFHELAEAYEKIDGGKGGSYAAGHNAALQRELELRDQRPYLKEYNTGAGGPANSPNPEGKIIIKQ
jgi:RHS repeat-associated protein